MSLAFISSRYYAIESSLSWWRYWLLMSWYYRHYFFLQRILRFSARCFHVMFSRRCRMRLHAISAAADTLTTLSFLRRRPIYAGRRHLSQPIFAADTPLPSAFQQFSPPIFTLPAAFQFSAFFARHAEPRRLSLCFTDRWASWSADSIAGNTPAWRPRASRLTPIYFQRCFDGMIESFLHFIRHC